MLLSQDRTLTRLGRPAAPREQIKRAYVLHLERLHKWLSLQSHMEVLLGVTTTSSNNLASRRERVGEVPWRQPDVGTMAKTVDLSLYRNRKASGKLCRPTRHERGGPKADAPLGLLSRLIIRSVLHYYPLHLLGFLTMRSFRILKSEISNRSCHETREDGGGAGGLRSAARRDPASAPGLAAVARPQPRQQGDRIHRTQDVAQGTHEEVERQSRTRRRGAGPGRR